jgi:hypothetical protein
MEYISREQFKELTQEEQFNVVFGREEKHLYLAVDNGISQAVLEWDRGEYLNPYNKSKSL